MQYRTGKYSLPAGRGLFCARHLVLIEWTDDNDHVTTGWSNVVTVSEDTSSSDPAEWTTTISLNANVLQWLDDHAAGRWVSSPIHGTTRHISGGFHDMKFLFLDKAIAKTFIETWGQALKSENGYNP